LPIPQIFFASAGIILHQGLCCESWSRFTPSLLSIYLSGQSACNLACKLTKFTSIDIESWYCKTSSAIAAQKKLQ